jgi:hypothetical protein
LDVNNSLVCLDIFLQHGAPDLEYVITNVWQCLLASCRKFTLTQSGLQRSTCVGASRMNGNRRRKTQKPEALWCWNLEGVIDAETYRKPIPNELTLSSIGEKEG